MCTALQTSAVEVRTGHFSFQLFLVMKVSVSRQEALIALPASSSLCSASSRTCLTFAPDLE